MAPDPPDTDIAGWRFGDCELDLAQRMVTRRGRPVQLTRRAFDVLLHLVRHHDRVVTRAELLARCWPGQRVTEGVVARILMRLRQALCDVEPRDAEAQHLIQTLPRVGYRFAGEAVALPPAVPAEAAPGDCFAAAPAALQLALLPVHNRTGDALLAWAELGLPSLVATGLRQRGLTGLATVQDVLVALQRVPDGAPAAECARTVSAALGTRFAWAGRLTCDQGSCVLHFALHAAEGVLHESTVVGDDVADVAGHAAARIAQWLVIDEAVAAAMPVDLGDAFLDEALRRALCKVRDDDLVGAEHLLDLLHDAGVQRDEVLLESARVALLLGRPHATTALQQLEQHAADRGSLHLQLEARLLRAPLLEQHGQMAGAARMAREAAERAGAAGLAELQLRATVMCARQTAAGMGEGARAMMSQTIHCAETSGNRVLLRDAYAALGHIAAFEQDWVAATRHHAMGLSVAQALHESARAVPLYGLSQAKLQLGQLREARSAGVEALRCARLSGTQPIQGRAAMAAAAALIACRQAGALAELLAALDGLDDRSVVMEVARESRCRATLLRLAGRHDEALACIAQARHAARKNPVLAAACVQERLLVLLAARRHDELQALCEPLLATPPACLDRRLHAWLELALAWREHALNAGSGTALRRLDYLLHRCLPSQAHAQASLGAAWIHLDRGQVAEAAARVAPLGAWRVQSPAGMLVDARLHHARGDMRHATQVLRRYLELFGESATADQHGALAQWEAGGRGQPRGLGGLEALLWLSAPS